MIGETATASWLEREAARILDFPRPPFPPEGGAYWLDDDGNPRLDLPVETWITARTAYVYSLARLARSPGALERARTALRGLTGPLHDREHGGWVESSPSLSTDKTAYAHASVLLAATTAVRAEIPGAGELVGEALDVIDRHLWDPRHGMSRDTMSRDWSEWSTYRGLNANMHLVEAFLAVPEAAAPGIRDRALGICRRAAGWAAENGWRLPEHFDEEWTPLLEFGHDRPDDPFKPYGSTPGHGFEWSRLLAGAASEASRDRGWLLEAAVALYDRSARDGWARDGHPGFVYTVDWNGETVVGRRLFWVAAEAVSAAEVLLRVTGDRRYADDREEWWRYIAQHFVDRERGSWIHELDARNLPSRTIWNGKPDLYHAFQACVIPGLPVTASVAASMERAHG